MKCIDADKLGNFLTERFKVCPINDDERHGRHCALIEIENFIDSLQQEQPSLPSNLEEAAENYYEYDCPYDGEARVVNREHDVWFPSQAIEDAFKAGAEWMAKQLKQE